MEKVHPKTQEALDLGEFTFDIVLKRSFKNENNIDFVPFHDSPANIIRRWHNSFGQN